MRNSVNGRFHPVPLVMLPRTLLNSPCELSVQPWPSDAVNALIQRSSLRSEAYATLVTVVYLLFLPQCL